MSVYSSGHARRSLIDTIAFRLLSQVATIFGYIVMVRGMHKEDFGVYNLLYSFVPVVSTIASLGLLQVLRRFQPEYLREGNAVAAAWLVKIIASWRFLSNVILLGVVLLTWSWVAPLFKMTPYRGEFAVFCILLLLHFQAAVLQSALAGHMLHRVSMGAMALLSIVKLVLYSAWVWFDTLTVERAIIADTIGYGLVYLVMQLSYYRHCTAKLESTSYTPPKAERKRLLRYGMYNNFNDAGTLFLDSKIDNFFIAAFLDPISVGVYAFYTRLNEMTGNWLPVRLFENVVMPMFFSMSPQDAARKTPQYFSLLLNLNLLVQWPLLAFTVAYHAELVHVVFGGKFIEHSWLLPIVFAFATVNSVAVPATLVAQYEEKSGAILLSKIFAFYNIASMVVLIPLAGLYGAAISSGSAQALKNLFIWWSVRKTAVWTNRWVALSTAIGLWGLVVIICEAAKSVTHLPAVVNLLIGVVVFSVASLLFLRTPALSTEDRTILASIFRGKEGRLMQRIGLLRPSLAGSDQSGT